MTVGKERKASLLEQNLMTTTNVILWVCRFYAQTPNRSPFENKERNFVSLKTSRVWLKKLHFVAQKEYFWGSEPNHLFGKRRYFLRKKILF